MRKQDPVRDPVIYVPPDAKINLENRNLPEPEVEYEIRKQFFDVDAVKDVTKGQYGKKG